MGLIQRFLNLWASCERHVPGMMLYKKYGQPADVRKILNAKGVHLCMLHGHLTYCACMVHCVNPPPANMPNMRRLRLYLQAALHVKRTPEAHTNDMKWPKVPAWSLLICVKFSVEWNSMDGLKSILSCRCNLFQQVSVH